ncbi:DNA-binding protein [Methanoculleus taiwanensis]|uniref:DNA-binding protein n=1 Tax=Methanoculleus taiwanensis TaxID=1550565 RepID=A0A498H4M5_9EURY|nr:metal-dependent transcriptional regulator [Methanoculleus taiwanensis]RXE56806.1 DNA-binding protein [Methanoculleus taiwanensis]
MRKKTIEEYIETIDALEKREGRAQTGMIAQEIDVKPPSVTEMLRKLEKSGLVEYESYSGATLTPTGRKMACDLQKKHRTVASFLEMLGVDHGIAETDACQIEHHVSPETAERLRLFVDYLRESPFGRECTDHFDRYCRERER